MEKRAEERRLISLFKEKVAASVRTPGTTDLPVFKRKEDLNRMEEPPKKTQKLAVSSLIKLKRNNSEECSSGSSTTAESSDTVKSSKLPATEGVPEKLPLIVAYGSDSDSES